MEPKMYDLKENPFFRQFLSISARQEVDKFVDLLRNGDFSNKKLRETIVMQALDEMLLDETGAFHYEYKPGTVFYRCRTVTDPQEIVEGGIQIEVNMSGFHSNGYDEPNSIEPPFFKTKAARNIKKQLLHGFILRLG